MMTEDEGRSLDQAALQARLDRLSAALRRADEEKYALMKDFPWQDIRKHWDGVNHHHSFDRYGFTYGWDVESTAWFNTDVLTYVGEVDILPQDSRRDDED